MEKFKALIPLDGSSFSAQVLPAVCRLLDPKQYHLTLVRVAPLPPEVTPLPTPPRPISVDGWLSDEYDNTWDRDLANHPVYASQIWESVRHELADDLSDDLHALKAAGFEVGLSVHFGDPAEELTRLTKDEAYDLIVMATHGRSGLQRALMGSVAEKVMRRARVPVMMIRPIRKAMTAGSMPVA